MTQTPKYQAVVLGASAGGMKLVKQLVMGLPANFSMSLIIVQHIADTSDGTWAQLLNSQSKILVKEADEKERIEPAAVYLAPSNYHLLIETDHTFTLTVEERVNYARPSIDVLFETAADAYGDKLIGIIGTGGNFDGAKGLQCIKAKGGLTIVQDPETAETPAMPRAAIREAQPAHILSPEDILKLLLELQTY